MIKRLENTKADQLNGLNLAYIGDGVYELLVREHMMQNGGMSVKNLHRQAVKYVCAEAQSRGVDKIIDKLTEKEELIYKRGRNANSHTVPKNASIADYRKATGLEALFGYLYLEGEDERIKEMFEIILSVEDGVLEK